MSPKEKKVGEISSGDLRLFKRVQQLIEQANISQALLQVHFTEEYKLNPTLAIRPDGSIWETVPEAESRALSKG